MTGADELPWPTTGSVVQLVSGGALMTAQHFRDSEHGIGMQVECIWIDAAGHFHSAWLEVQCLRKPEQPSAPSSERTTT